MAKELREYQRECIDAVLRDWKEGARSVVACLPTGTGKTFTALTLLKEYGENFLFAVPRDFLVTQTVKQAQEMGFNVYGVSGKEKSGNKSAPNIIATVQWLNARKGRNIKELLESRDIKVVVLDECHHAITDSYALVQMSILKSNEETKCLGLTATLQRADKKPLRLAFQKLSFWKALSYFINNGFLAKANHYLVETDIDVTTVKMDKDGDDFIEKSMIDAVAYSTNWKERTLETWNSVARGKNLKTIVFCANVQLSIEFRDLVRSSGVSCEHIDGTTPKARRAEILEQFAKGEITMLTNCLVFTEGFDVPDAECAIIARPTKSQCLYIQMIGRVFRTAPGKESCTILDITDKHHRLIQYADIDPPKKIVKVCNELLHNNIDIFGEKIFEFEIHCDEFAQNMVEAYDIHGADLMFNTGEETFKRLIDLTSTGVSWRVFGNRAIVNGDNLLIVLPVEEYTKYLLKDVGYVPNEDEKDSYAVLDVKREDGVLTGKFECIGISDALTVMDIAIDNTIIKKQWQNEDAAWRYQKVSNKQASILSKLGFNEEVIMRLKRGDASNLITYIGACKTLEMPLCDKLVSQLDETDKSDSHDDDWKSKIFKLEDLVNRVIINPNAFERNFILDVAKKIRMGFLRQSAWTVKRDQTLNQIYSKYVR